MTVADMSMFTGR